MRDTVSANQQKLARLDVHIDRIRTHLADDERRLEDLARRRLFRRPDHGAIDTTQQRIDNQRRYLDRLHNEQARAAGELERSRSQLRNTESDVSHLPAVEAAVERRQTWFLDHRAELDWEADLAARLAGATKATDLDSPEHEHNASDLNELFRSIDLRTLDLSPSRPRAGIERHLYDTLGISRPDDPMDRLCLPSPARGLDGPDLGMGL
jgi:chromosome segregation ATPase